MSEQPIKAVCFDVDGTLLSFKTHEVLPSSVYTLKKLKEAGIFCILSTGRPYYELPFLDFSWFSGCVTFNGQYCYVDDEVILDNPMDPRDVAVVVHDVLEHKYETLFMEKDRSYNSAKNENCLKLEKLINSSFPVGNPLDALHNPIYQLNIYLSPGEEDTCIPKLVNSKYARWCDYFVDAMPKDGGKEKGVKALLDYFNVDPEYACAFGDGGNDLGMIELVGYGIAMGNGSPELKEKAYAVCEDCDSDGIYHTCVRLGLIEPCAEFEHNNESK